MPGANVATAPVPNVYWAPGAVGDTFAAAGGDASGLHESVQPAVMRTNTLSKAGASLDIVWNLPFFRFFAGLWSPVEKRIADSSDGERKNINKDNISNEDEVFCRFATPRPNIRLKRARPCRAHFELLLLPRFFENGFSHYFPTLEHHRQASTRLCAAAHEPKITHVSCMSCLAQVGVGPRKPC